MAPGLKIGIKKNADGRTSLSCTRPDGTTTWQRLEAGQAAFFPRHDLTHYAVETTLSHRHGFFGTVADGWDLTDFGTPWPRGHLPPITVLSEMIVGYFDQERATGRIFSAQEVNELLAEHCREQGLVAPALSDDDLARVRQRRAELFRQWEALPFGETLEVKFDIAGG